MARELAITLYLFVFRILFNMCKLFPQKKKTVFVASFGDNIFYTLKEVEKQTDDRVVILKTSQCKIDFNADAKRTVLDFKANHIIDWVRSIYHLATCEKVFVDNYYGFLSVTNFDESVVCIQLWHAAGAIKQFGFKDPSTDLRTKRAHDRFRKVYQRFDHVVVGSEKMAAIFRASFGITNEQIHRSGIPRTDFFFNDIEKKNALHSIRSAFPNLNDKKVILYAPTYRDDELSVSDIQLDLELMYQHLNKDYMLLLRLHPAVKVDLCNQFPDFVVDVSHYPNLNHLLIVTDLLITDYSSIPFEFSLLNKPMIFFAYDLAEYTKARGFWENYEDNVPGPIVLSSESLIETIKENNFDMDKVKVFAEQWNMYSRGFSSNRLVDSFYTEPGEHVKVAEN